MDELKIYALAELLGKLPKDQQEKVGYMLMGTVQGFALASDLEQARKGREQHEKVS